MQKEEKKKTAGIKVMASANERANRKYTAAVLACASLDSFNWFSSGDKPVSMIYRRIETLRGVAAATAFLMELTRRSAARIAAKTVFSHLANSRLDPPSVHYPGP